VTHRPNIVLILSDQHRGDVMGCAGNTVASTPNLDRLAAEGVLFRRCNTSSPLCMPARSCLATGQYPNQHGVWGNSTEADRYGPSHVRNIRDAGYHTAVIGKTHLWIHGRDAGHSNQHEPALHDWGFQDTHESMTFGIWSGCYYADWLAERDRLVGLKEYMRTLGRSRAHPWETPPSVLPNDEHRDTYCTRTAAQWIRNYQGDKPFYLQICPSGPHPPFDSPAEYRELYRPEDMPLAIMDPPSEPVSPQVERWVAWSRLQSMTECQNRLMRAYYYAKVSHVDHAIGIVLKALEESNLMDNTWIVYTSDHGELLGDHRINQKNVFYEGALNIPLIIRPPGGSPAWSADGLTDHFDICASLLDAAGAEPLDGSSGISLLPKVQAGPDARDAQEGKDVVFSEVQLHSMARNAQYKMTIDSLTRQPLELYDMENDPTELRNLANEPSLRGVCERFLNDYFCRLLDGMDDARVKAYQETWDYFPDLKGEVH